MQQKSATKIRTAMLSLRMQPEFKALAMRLAEVERRTLTAEIEHLITERAKKLGLTVASPSK